MRLVFQVNNSCSRRTADSEKHSKGIVTFNKLLND